MAKCRHTLRATKVLPALLIVAIIGTLAVMAQPHPRGVPRHGPGGGFGLENTLATLGLTADQQAAVDKILSAHRESAETDRESFMKAETALHAQVSADTFDEQAIRQAAAGVASLEADRAVAEARLLNEVRAVLTPEQRAKLQEAMQISHGMRGPAGP